MPKKDFDPVEWLKQQRTQEEKQHLSPLQMPFSAYEKGPMSEYRPINELLADIGIQGKPEVKLPGAWSKEEVLPGVPITPREAMKPDYGEGTQWARKRKFQEIEQEINENIAGWEAEAEAEANQRYIDQRASLGFTPEQTSFKSIGGPFKGKKPVHKIIGENLMQEFEDVISDVEQLKINASVMPGPELELARQALQERYAVIRSKATEFQQTYGSLPDVAPLTPQEKRFEQELDLLQEQGEVETLEDPAAQLEDFYQRGRNPLEAQPQMAQNIPLQDIEGRIRQLDEEKQNLLQQQQLPQTRDPIPQPRTFTPQPAGNIPLRDIEGRVRELGLQDEISMLQRQGEIELPPPETNIGRQAQDVQAELYAELGLN